MEKPDDIVGHKTLDSGERDQHGLPIYRHVPLTRAEADAMLARIEAREHKRAELMPDEKSAIDMLFEAWLRLKELGWREAIYCPKDGSHFQVIEAGSTGIHDCAYQGEWPTGSWWLYGDGDVWPGSRPVLFKLYPEDQVKEDARMAAARERFQKEMNDGRQSASEN